MYRNYFLEEIWLAFILLFSASLFFLPQTSRAATPYPAGKSGAPGPTKNFYRWVNREWLESTPVPSDKPGISNFEAIQEKVNKRLVELLEQLKNDPGKTEDDRKLLTLYEAYTNLDRREAQGLSPLRQELAQIDRATSLRDIARLFARFQKIGVAAPLIYDVTTDLKNSERNIIFVGQSGLGLEQEAYINDDERSRRHRNLYRDAIRQLFGLASEREPDLKADKVLDMERELAKIQWSKVENRDLARISNLSDYASLRSKAPGTYIDVQFAELGMPTRYPVNITQPSYVEAFDRFFTAHDVESWKSYLKARLLYTYSKLLDERFRKTVVDFEIGRGLYETEQPMPLQAVSYLNGNAGLLLGKFYVEHTFKESDKRRVTDLVHSIVDEYRTAVSVSTRMTANTKRKALEKLDAMTFRIGYPEHWKDYTALHPQPGNPAENHKRLSRFEFERHVARLSKPVDNSDWDYPPQVVNAFYEQTSNSFVLLASILNPPFYSADASDAVLYGGMGFVIGHEIGHGFDDQGSRFDAHGNLANWWTQADAQAFDTVKQRLISQANAYEILPGKHLKGALEIGEIIGDLSGSEIAYMAYRKTAAAKGRVNDDDQREYFRQLAVTWRAKFRPQVQMLLLDIDPHPPSEYRANGTVKNFDEFHKLFGTKPGDPMYLAPSQRVTVW